MCDTFLAMSDITTDGSVILGKNSDREPNEAEAITRIPVEERTGKELQTTFISIPNSGLTKEAILARPFQMWGAEMGVNSQGVAIGNEAVFTKLKIAKKNDGLTGMDMLRLALERGDTAERALEIIIELLEEYGQDACGGYEEKLYYHNSFLIADKTVGFVLETADRHWVAKKITKGYYAISNGLTIESEFDLSSKGLMDFALKKGWVKNGEDFNFKKAFSDKFYTYFSRGWERRALSEKRGKEFAGKINAETAMEILRTHKQNESEPKFHIKRNGMGSLCMHASGMMNPSQTAGSMVAVLRQDKPNTYWFTGTSAPCLSVFIPFFIPGKTGTNESLLSPGAKKDDSLWWRAEELHRKTRKNYPEYSALYRDERKNMEKEFHKKEKELFELQANGNEFESKSDVLTKESLNRVYNSTVQWNYKIDDTKNIGNIKNKTEFFAPLYSAYWNKTDKKAGL